MAQDHAASVQGVCVRATRLAADGSPATGPNASYASDAFVSMTFTPQYDTGDEISQKGANGILCVYYKAADTLKNVTVALSICEPDPELTELLTGGTLLAVTSGTDTTLAADATAGQNYIDVSANPGNGAFTIGTGGTAEAVVVTGVTGTTTPFRAYIQFPLQDDHVGTGGTAETVTADTTNVGYAVAPIGIDPTPHGVGVEVWSYAVSGSRRAANNPYFRWVLPQVFVRLTGDHAIENGLMANAFTGFGNGNAFFGGGPADDWLFPTDRAYQYARDNAAPTGVNGYITVGP
jgi:hypothetical protein